MSTPGFLNDRFHAGTVALQALRPNPVPNFCTKEYADCQARCNADPGDPYCPCLCRNAYCVCSHRCQPQQC